MIHTVKALFLVLLTAGLGAAVEDRPNIIIVMADDMGFSDLGCYGGEIRTPAIDRLAREGVRFTHFYNCALCGPSRASLMTGCQPWDVGQAPGQGIFRNLERNCATVMELLKAGGYRTGAVGRLDMVTADDWHDPVAIARWVDRFLGSASGGPGNYFREAKGTPWFQDGERHERPEGAYSTDLISDFVVEFIGESAGREAPFFLYVSHYAPHWPLQAKEEEIAACRDLYAETERVALMEERLRRLKAMGLVPEETALPESMVHPAKDVASEELPLERMAIHAAMVESIDRSLARTLAALEKAGKLDNTLVLVLSDNGASDQLAYNRPVPDGVRPGGADSFLNQGAALAALSNTPFRDFKTSFHEGGIASPLVAWWPAGVRGGGRLSSRLTHIADITPTCLELAGVSYPERFRGRELIPLAGKSFVATLERTGDEVDDPRVLVWPGALREGAWKLVRSKPGPPELYHLGRDRNEARDLAAEFSERVEAMGRLHDRLGP